MGVVQLVRLVAFSSTNGPTATAAAAAGWLLLFFFALWSPVMSERFIFQRISTQKISRSKQQKKFSTHDHTHTHTHTEEGIHSRSQNCKKEDG
jgi:ABC-type nickel/cobalt efflux system permease component RcnA